MQLKRTDINDLELEELLSVMSDTYGFDFHNYSKASIKRRISRFMEDAGFNSTYDLKFSLVNNASTFDHFLQRVTVNVTEMFRDPQFYKTIKENILPELSSYPIIKIWHAGCSSGEEVFSMAILLHEAGLLKRSKIYATDLNPSNIEKSKKGIVPLSSLKEYNQNYTQAGGQHSLSDYFTVAYNNAIFNKELRGNILFSQHNLVTDQVFNEFQIIFCRNVMIYFNKELQDRVVGLFFESLSPLGYLALGLKESLIFTSYKSKFETVSKENKIYRRIR